MRALLDTNVLLWWLEGSNRIRPTAEKVIAEASNDIFVSAASAWEIAIKVAIGRLPVREAPAVWLPRELEANAFAPLPVVMAHALAVAALPHHHRDPFDRLLIAQAQLEQMTLITGDERLAAYGVDLVLC